MGRPMTRLTYWLVGALLTRQTWTLELFLAIQSLTWGLWLLGPWSAFGQVPAAFTVLGLVPEPIWGGLFAAHGLAHLIALWKGDPHLCRRAAIVTAGLWSVVLGSFLVTVPLSTAVPIYGVNVLGASWVYMRLHWRFG